MQHLRGRETTHDPRLMTPIHSLEGAFSFAGGCDLGRIGFQGMLPPFPWEMRRCEFRPE
jgi:hypothetical protein